MRAVVQRVTRASVRVRGETVGSIDGGLLVYMGVGRQDTDRDVQLMADKIVNLRVFTGTDGKMNRSLREHGGAILVIPQFTLYGDVRQGRRPSYTSAADPEVASPLIEAFVRRVREMEVVVQTGVFRESMEVDALNQGPVTILIDSSRTF